MRMKTNIQCPHGCGPLAWVDTMYQCWNCGDEWAEDAIIGQPRYQPRHADPLGRANGDRTVGYEGRHRR